MVLVGGVLEVLVESNTVGGECGGSSDGGRFFCDFYGIFFGVGCVGGVVVWVFVVGMSWVGGS